MKKLLHFILFALLVNTAQAQDLIRGPYQQSATTQSVKIMWRTSEASNSWVKVGDTPDNLDRVFSIEDLNIDHNILVTGLLPHTKYYYSIGHDDVTLASGDNHYILTAKAYGDTTGFSFWTIGDAGKANNPQVMARDAFLEHTKDKPVDFAIMLGDNAYQNGTDEEYQQKVFGSEFGYDSILRYLHYYPTPGNHDYNILRGDNILNYLDPTIDKGPYYDIHEVFKNGEGGGVPSGTEIYYSFDYGHVHFISLNSETFPWTRTDPSPMKKWLRKDLEANKLPWTIVIFHQPPFTSGSHSSDDSYEFMMMHMRKYMLPILEEAGVDLVLNGHSHVYERSYLINGFYLGSYAFDPAIHGVNMTSGNPDLGETYVKEAGGKGTVYSVIGNSGSYTSEGSFPTKMHPVHLLRDAGKDVTGSIVVDVTGSTLNVEYINRFGEILDKYSIFKQIEAVPTSIKENYVDIFEMTAYPNPSSDVLSINFNNPSMSKANITVSDMTGRQVLAQEATGQGSATVQVNGWNQLAAGNYVVSLNVNGKLGSITVAKAE
ncbi:MAG TPA: metallophosphoesterase [Chitinophagales bacterium]|nr:metallophosphoesterase [Chitinophagales bacterium]